MLFKKNKTTLSEIKELKFDLEKDLQELVEENIDQVFSLQFVASEFQLNSLRIDTLAFDQESNAFVIIEYKRDKSFSVIDQGYAYLSLMLNNKAEFILLYQEKIGKLIKKDAISWSETKVIFVANSFTAHQRQAINFKDLPIELWEAKRYTGDVYSFSPIKAGRHTESIKTISKDETISKVSKEVKTYTIEDHAKPGWNNSRELYEELKEQLLDLDERLDENIVKAYIGFKIGAKVVVGVKVHKSKLVIEFFRVRPQDLQDPEGRLREMKNAMKHYNKYVSMMDVSSSDDIQYAMLLVRQLIKKLFS
ncbi:MAG: DUF5655 domain-containing protein [Lewinella sp.]|uniref:DUF5655 domain-containing protein n=1 Tax=Lewinella sp. TaxID=2004506 RepID=UPI003D6C67B8